MTTASILKAVRLTHHYIGVFIAPAVLFFSFTGFLQMFSLHETTRGSSYVPPAIIVKMASIHKKAALPTPRPPAPPKADKPEAPRAEKPDKPAAPPAPVAKPSYHWPEKIFFGIVAVGLFTSTLSGLYMAWKYNRNKILVAVLFVAGLILPIILLPF
jgi:hypothetical protein